MVPRMAQNRTQTLSTCCKIWGGDAGNYDHMARKHECHPCMLIAQQTVRKPSITLTFLFNRLTASGQTPLQAWTHSSALAAHIMPRPLGAECHVSILDGASSTGHSASRRMCSSRPVLSVVTQLSDITTCCRSQPKRFPQSIHRTCPQTRCACLCAWLVKDLGSSPT